MPRVLYHANAKVHLLFQNGHLQVWPLISPDGQKFADFAVAYNYLSLAPIGLIKVKEDLVCLKVKYPMRIDYDPKHY